MLIRMMIYWITVVVVCILAHSYDAASIGHTELCSHKLIFKLSLYSQRQTNGKWETHAELVGGNNTEVSDIEKDLHLDVKQTIATCNCTKDMLSVEANIIAPPPRPGKNYTLLRGLGYYFLQKSLEASEEANFLCNNEGAHLTVINSKEEANAIRKMVQDNSPNMQVFVGLYKQAGNDIITVYGNPYEIPDGITQEKTNTTGDSTNLCGTINGMGSINFVPCQWQLPSICEQEL